jgi:hypothetical protein
LFIFALSGGHDPEIQVFINIWITGRRALYPSPETAKSAPNGEIRQMKAVHTPSQYQYYSLYPDIGTDGTGCPRL